MTQAPINTQSLNSDNSESALPAKLPLTKNLQNDEETAKLQEFGTVQYLRRPPRSIKSRYLSEQNRQEKPEHMLFTKEHELFQNEITINEFDRTSFHYNRDHNWKYSQIVDSKTASEQIIGILPPAENFIHVIMVHIIDVLNGQRPAKHLQTWMTPQAYQALIRRTRLGMAIHGGAAKCAAPRIRKIRVFHPTPNIAEAGVVLFDGRRIRGAAIRLETRKNRWHIAEIEVI